MSVDLIAKKNQVILKLIIRWKYTIKKYINISLWQKRDVTICALGQCSKNILCWHATPVANVLWKPLIIGLTVKFGSILVLIELDWIGLNWLFNVTINDISVIYVTAHRCAGGLKKKLLIKVVKTSNRTIYIHFLLYVNIMTFWGYWFQSLTASEPIHIILWIGVILICKV